MLVYKAQQVVGVTKLEPKPWEMDGRSGVIHQAKMAVVGGNMDVASITIKAKSAEELNGKVAKFTVGKPADIPIVAVVPVFKSGDRRASGYELTA